MSQWMTPLPFPILENRASRGDAEKSKAESTGLLIFKIREHGAGEFGAGGTREISR